MKTIHALVTLASGVALAACGNQDDNSTEFATVSMNLTVDVSDAPAPAGDAGSGETSALVVHKAQAFIRHLEFYRADAACDDDDDDDRDAGYAGDAGCPDGEKLRVDGPWIVDLMTGESTPSMAELRIPAGSYRRIDVRFEDADKNAAKGLDVPAELKDLSLVASGDYHGEVAESFDLRLKFNNDARFESRAGIDLRAEAPSDVMLMLDVQSWFDVVSLDECFRKDRLDVVDGSLQIDDEKQRCNDVENAIKREMKHAGRIDKTAPR